MKHIIKDWQEEQTLDDFIGFISTGNTYIGMSESNRIELHDLLKQLFDDAGGSITRHYICLGLLNRCRLLIYFNI